MEPPLAFCYDERQHGYTPSNETWGEGGEVDFFEVLDRVVDLLRSRGRVTYGALKLQFQLDDTPAWRSQPGEASPP
jgi:hypothetical protein